MLFINLRRNKYFNYSLFWGCSCHIIGLGMTAYLPTIVGIKFIRLIDMFYFLFLLQRYNFFFIYANIFMLISVKTLLKLYKFNNYLQ